MAEGYATGMLQKAHAERDALQSKLDQVRELYVYMMQTIPTAWAPIMIVEKLAAVLDEDPYEHRCDSDIDHDHDPLPDWVNN